jgi:ribonuclease HI
MIWKAFTDGASRGNPGEAGIGIIVLDERGTTALSVHEYIGTCTNNAAEYRALITLLERAGGFPCGELRVHSDSELMVRQMNGSYRVRDRGLRPLYQRAVILKSSLPFPCTLRYVPREENREADLLANRGIDEHRPVREPDAPAKNVTN